MLKVNQWLRINQIVNKKKQHRENKKNHRMRTAREKSLLLTWSWPRKRAITRRVSLHSHQWRPLTSQSAKVKVSSWTLHNRSSTPQKTQVTTRRACQNHEWCCQRSKKKAKATGVLTKASQNKSSLQTKVSQTPRSTSSMIGTFSMSLTTSMWRTHRLGRSERTTKSLSQSNHSQALERVTMTDWTNSRCKRIVLIAIAQSWTRKSSVMLGVTSLKKIRSPVVLGRNDKVAAHSSRRQRLKSSRRCANGTRLRGK